MKVVDYIAYPGSGPDGALKRGAGDDRYVFDEAAGWAVVIDGATDVGPVRLFPKAESDAARFAELAARDVLADAPKADETLDAWLPRFVARLRDSAAKEARVPIDQAPRASLPTAAATLVRLRNGQIEGVTLGDTLAIVRNPGGAIGVIGDNGKPADENVRARRVMAMTPDERKKWLQDTRALHNTDKGYWVFGVQPEAAGHVIRQTLPCPSGTKALLMTDGFYRLVSPYGRYNDERLIETAIAKGLGPLMTELRGLEADPADNAKIGRFKTSDDATALLLEF